MPLDQYPEKSSFRDKALPAFVVLLIFAGLYISSLYNYLLFHTLVEISCVVISCVIFVLAWNTRAVQDNQYLLFLGTAFLFTAVPELLHTLAYKGFGVFPGRDANMATQFWISFRYLAGLSFLIAPLYLTHPLRVGRTMTVYAVVTAVTIGSIFLQVFPACYVEGIGLTPFKINSEYVIIAIFLASFALLLRHRRMFDRNVLGLMATSILASVASELSFTQYVSVFGPANLIGHLFLFLSAYFLYRAIIVTGVVDPSRVLFRSLKESEAKYRSLFNNMIDGFAFHKIILDEGGKPVDYIFLEVNDAFELLTGLKKDDIIGKRVTEVLPGIERDPADWIGIYGRVALTGQDLRFEQHAVPINKWFSISAYSPMRDHFVAIFEDITARKLAEGEIAQLNSELKQNVLRLEAANKELESFSYSVSHDLRAPLRAIDGFSRAIEEEFGAKLGDAGRDNIRRVRSGVGNMGRLIDALLNLSRLSRYELDRVAFDLSELVKGKAQELMLTEHGRRVEFVTAPRIMAHGDPLMLGVVIENLLGNAWKFTSKREDAKIEFGVTTKEGKDVYFVRDNGAGFDMTYAGKLFSPFHRLHPSREFPGLGIGLATVDRIIRRHDGKIWAEGAVGKGATFYFTL